jgi:hypothetical protein
MAAPSARMSCVIMQASGVGLNHFAAFEEYLNLLRGTRFQISLNAQTAGDRESVGGRWVRNWFAAP